MILSLSNKFFFKLKKNKQTFKGIIMSEFEFSKWGICPDCKKVYDAKKEKADAKVAQALANEVPEKDYLRLVAMANFKPMQATLKEQHSIGVTPDGEFEINYFANCANCRFTYGHYSIRESLEDTTGQTKMRIKKSRDIKEVTPPELPFYRNKG